ncbi:histone deacetylase 10 isoform X3 [Nothoprocta perdicaria]|uniref:histone deacetylase 10 isoform X3 n=1 Tax=Nothoprocta perdicaria TaxID=30464 RepID=UPI000E1BCF84|nr:histone deacetylase 10 isoform X3 [Nothoprocta perdicaria]
MASGTALIYDEEMTSHKLLWNDPICDIEVPERLSSSYEQLERYHLVERCVRVPAREASEEEILLVHSSEHLEVAKSTQAMNEEELKSVSGNYDAFFFHPSTYRCAKLAVGASLQLVDSVMSGKVCNGMALVRPPGHHSQRNAANGFCLFNNVAIAAKYAKRKYGLQRILIVDWDVHHGQGTQYIFEEDPSILYFSWHRYEHQEFWPSLKESDYDSIGLGRGKGRNINLPWNKVGMGNSDYLAAFFHVLLPVAFEFDPELVLVSSGYDSGIGDPEGQMDATPDVFAHLTHFLMQLANGKLCVILEGGYHLKSLAESVCMTVKTLLGDPVPQITGEMAPCLSAFYGDLVKQDETLLSLGSMLAVLDKILMKQACNGIAESPAASVSAAVALRHSVRFGFQRVLCIFVGDMEIIPNTEDGRILVIHVCEKQKSEKTNSKHYISLNWKEGAEGNDFFSAVFGFILPVAYSYQANLTIIAVGPNRSLGTNGISLLFGSLRGLAESRILAVIENTDINLMPTVAKALAGDSTPDFGVYAPPSQEKVHTIKLLRDQFQQEWKMLQCSGKSSLYLYYSYTYIFEMIKYS